MEYIIGRIYGIYIGYKYIGYRYIGVYIYNVYIIGCICTIIGEYIIGHIIWYIYSI